MFVFLGSFTAHNSLNDIIVTLIVGLLGYFMVLFEWKHEGEGREPSQAGQDPDDEPDSGADE